jgi:SAM-dependent methyltransferase
LQARSNAGAEGVGIATRFEEWARGTLRDPLQHFRSRRARHCPACDHEGYFISAGPRREARCPNCSSKERDRIFALYLQRYGIRPEGRTILHFSPERPFFRQWKNLTGYVAGDVKASSVANAIVDITDIQFDEGTFDLIICHHVLEHVPDDAKGISECHRVLKRDGGAFFSVPLDIGRPTTWEPAPGMSKKEVEAVCGWDHVRLYGRDFPERLRTAGFEVEEIAFTAEEAERHRLSGAGVDKVFVARKSAEPPLGGTTIPSHSPF